MFLLVRNDDGYPIVIAIYDNKEECQKEAARLGMGYFTRNFEEG